MRKAYEVVQVMLALAKSNPPKVYVRVAGTVPTTGWTSPQLVPYVYVAPPKDGIWEFDLIAEPPLPESVVLRVLSPVVAQYLWEGNLKSFKGAKVYASINAVTQLLNDSGQRARNDETITITKGGDQPLPLGNGDPWPR